MRADGSHRRKVIERARRSSPKSTKNGLRPRPGVDRIFDRFFIIPFFTPGILLIATAISGNVFLADIAMASEQDFMPKTGLTELKMILK